MWTSPFVKGGASLRTKTGAPERRRCIASYSPVLSQWATRAGSRCASPARIGKFVLGSCNVSLRSCANRKKGSERVNLAPGESRHSLGQGDAGQEAVGQRNPVDRKSTRLNSSHLGIS